MAFSYISQAFKDTLLEKHHALRAFEVIPAPQTLEVTPLSLEVTPLSLLVTPLSLGVTPLFLEVTS